MKKTIFALLTVALAITSAKTFPVTFSQPAIVAGQTLAPGDYSVDFDGTKALIKRGKISVECNVKVEKADKKFESGSLRFANRDGKQYLSEIRLAGTDTRLVVN